LPSLERESAMALYKYITLMMQSNDSAFDQLNEPSTAAPWPGIYRCQTCGHELAIAQGHTLPPQNHHHHQSGVGRIQWRLVISPQKD
jgi:hypothetical protein